jgi:hypothetical protein
MITSCAEALSAGERVLTGLVMDVSTELVPRSADFSLGGLPSMSMDSGDGVLPFVVTVLKSPMDLSSPSVSSYSFFPDVFSKLKGSSSTLLRVDARERPEAAVLLDQ